MTRTSSSSCKIQPGQIVDPGCSRETLGNLETFNALRIAQRAPLQAFRGGILGPVGGWLGIVLTEQNPFDLVRGRIKSSPAV